MLYGTMGSRILSMVIEILTIFCTYLGNVITRTRIKIFIKGCTRKKADRRLLE